jgi:Na+/H+-dicarboxylate symporter
MSHTRVLLGLCVGAVAGVTVNAFFGSGNPTVEWIVAQFTEPIGELFLRLLLMMVIPLVFSSLVVGVAGVGDIRKLGRIGLKCLAYTIVISGISVAIGIGLANLVRPGKRIQPATAQALVQRYSADASRRVQAASQSCR